MRSNREVDDHALNEFMMNFIRARTSLYEIGLDAYDEFQATYFQTGYTPYNLRKSALNSSAERVLEVLPRGHGGQVITSGGAGFGARSRYALALEGDHLRIRSIEFECTTCRGSGHIEGRGGCRSCQGTGWIRMRNIS
jgi:hypothetical protein